SRSLTGFRRFLYQSYSAAPGHDQLGAVHIVHAQGKSPGLKGATVSAGGQLALSGAGKGHITVHRGGGFDTGLQGRVLRQQYGLATVDLAVVVAVNKNIPTGSPVAPVGHGDPPVKTNGLGAGED